MQSSTEELVAKAMARRVKWGFSDGEAFRIVDGQGDGMPGVFIESYAGHWVVGTRDVKFPDGLKKLAGSEGCRSIWWKRLEIDQKAAPVIVCGEQVDGGVISVIEKNWKLEIQLESGYSQGIFLDQRTNRNGVFDRSGHTEKPILNLFAYTCGFSVAAAVAGAETVSIDLSRNYLDWGKRNFELSGIDPSGHGFLRDDAFAVLNRFRKRGRMFSGIVLDPPTFSRNDKGKVFRVESDYSRLVEAAVAVLEEGGWMLCSSNTRKVGDRQFRAMVEEGLRRGLRVKEGRMPPDFTGEKYSRAFGCSNRHVSPDCGMGGVRVSVRAMRILRYSDADFEETSADLRRTAIPEEGVRDTVEAILAAVRERGDEALLEFAKKFDGAEMGGVGLQVTREEFETAEQEVPEEAKRLIGESLKNVKAFAKNSLRQNWSATNAQGAEVGEVFQPFGRVGVYVPGGTAPLVSTAIMTAGFAGAAGVPEIVACTPCGKDLKVNSALLYALQVSGVTEAYKVGGAQAIAALAYGTESIPSVVKIFGPGNRFVVEAKRQVIGAVSIDLLPGPSEVMVLADDSARADWVAADLLAQAEHGGDSGIVLLTPSEKLVGEVEREVERQAASLSRQDQLKAVLNDGYTVVLVSDLAQGVELANAYAPEHLSLVVEDEEAILPKITTSGAIFIGGYSPIAAGDFLAGPSHVLPTGGAGKSFPGLTADQFQRRTSIVRYSKGSISDSAPLIEGLSALEGLDAHGKSATIRLR